MSYEELKKVLRTGYPGLEVTTDQVTDNQIRGLWRGLDDDLSGEVSVQEFMIFFRRHGREHSMFKPTDHDLASQLCVNQIFAYLVDFTQMRGRSRDHRKKKYNSHRRN